MKNLKKAVFLLLAVVTIGLNLSVVSAATIKEKGGNWTGTSTDLDGTNTLGGLVSPTYVESRQVKLGTSLNKDGGTYKDLMKIVSGSNVETSLKNDKVNAVYFGRIVNLSDTKLTVLYTKDGTEQKSWTAKDGTKYTGDLTGKELYTFLTKMKAEDTDAWNSLMNTANSVDTTKAKEAQIQQSLWCFTDPFDDNYKIEDSCDTEYYLVIAGINVSDETGSFVINITNTSTTQDYQLTTGLYEVAPTKTNCDKPVTPPPTGINTPYIIAGVAVIGGIALILVSKKKRFI